MADDTHSQEPQEGSLFLIDSLSDVDLRECVCVQVCVSPCVQETRPGLSWLPQPDNERVKVEFYSVTIPSAHSPCVDDLTNQTFRPLLTE